MGRGRAKAKQVKVARQLKYNTGGTDLDRLRNELGVGKGAEDSDGDHDELADRYGYLDHSDEGEDDDEEDEEEEAGDA